MDPITAPDNLPEENPFLDRIGLNFEGGLVLASPFESAEANPGSHFELKPSYLLPIDSYWIQGFTQFSLDRVEEDPRFGGAVGAQISLFPFSSLDYRFFLGAAIGASGGIDGGGCVSRHPFCRNHPL